MSKPEQSGSPSRSQGGIVLVTAKIVGISPLMLDPMTDETQDNIVFKRHVQVKTDISHEQVAAEKVTKNAAGQIVVPMGNLRACLIGGGTMVKFDAKSKISTLGSTKLFSFLRLLSEELLLTDHDGRPLTDEDWVVDKRPGRLPTGVATIIRRPKFKIWATEFPLEYDSNVISEDKLFELFRAAGLTQGLCSFRPNCKGEFGQFELRRWIRESRRPAISNLEIIDRTAA